MDRRRFGVTLITTVINGHVVELDNAGPAWRAVVWSGATTTECAGFRTESHARSWAESLLAGKLLAGSAHVK